MQKPNLAILLSRFPFPLVKGDSLRAYYQIMDLSKSFNIYLHCLVNEVPNALHIAEVDKFVKNIHYYELEPIDGFLEIGLHFFNGLPNQVNMFTDEDIFWEMQDNLSTQNIDVVYCQLARMAKYALTLDKPKVLDFQDAFSKNYERSMVHSNWIWKFLYSIEARRMKRFERKLVSRMHACTIISATDKKAISESEKIYVVPNGVDTNKYLDNNSKKIVDICFTGNLEYAPNIQAVGFLAMQIMPLLRKKMPNIRVLVAGATPSEAVVEYCSRAQITLKANVPDMVEVYNSTHLFVAPLFAGAGLQNKILEAMACGTPCVTTDVVNNSLGAIDCNQIAIANSAESFVEIICKILNDATYSKSLSEKAKVFVAENYQWQIANKKLIEILLSVKK